MTGAPGTLAASLNELFGLRLADAAEARAWLIDGGFARLDAWLAGHAADDPGEAEETGTTESQDGAHA